MMEALVVEKSVQHRVVGKLNYTPVATIPTKKVQKIVKPEPPKRGEAVAIEATRKRSLTA
jgi:hypothetical protein